MKPRDDSFALLAALAAVHVPASPARCTAAQPSRRDAPPASRRSQEAGARRPGHHARERRQDDVHSRQDRGAQGEQIRFQLRNNGALDHEFMLATVEENLKHTEEMKKNPDMEHDDPNAKRLAPKTTGEIVWQFTKAGRVRVRLPDPRPPRGRHVRHDHRQVNRQRKEKHMLKNLARGVARCCSAVSAAVAARRHGEGQVTKIDKAAGKITLRHGPIKNLDMDSMTMVFRVADPAMLKKVKAGDKIKFEADRVNGQITVTKIGKGH